MIRENSRWTARPLFIVLVFVEVTDLIFERLYPCDLRAGAGPVPGLHLERIRHSRFAIIVFPTGRRGRLFPLPEARLSVVIGFVAIKMLLTDFFKVPTGWSLAVIAFLLGMSIRAPWMFSRETTAHTPVQHPPLNPGYDEETASVEHRD